MKSTPLDRFVENQEVGLADDGAGEQGALEFAARQLLQARRRQMADADGIERRVFARRSVPARQPQEATQRQRHGLVDREPLRDIADAEPGAARHVTRIGPHQAEQDLGHRRFPRPVRSDHRDDLAGAYRDIDIADDPASVAMDPDAARLDQRGGLGRFLGDGGGVGCAVGRAGEGQERHGRMCHGGFIEGERSTGRMGHDQGNMGAHAIPEQPLHARVKSPVDGRRLGS